MPCQVEKNIRKSKHFFGFNGIVKPDRFVRKKAVNFHTRFIPEALEGGFVGEVLVPGSTRTTTISAKTTIPIAT